MRLLVCVALFAVLLVIAARELPAWLAWVGGGFFIFVGGWAMLANWIIPFRKGGGSLIPLLGGLFVAAGFATVPFDCLNSFWWVPPLVDLGCVPLLALTPGFLLYRALLIQRGTTP